MISEDFLYGRTISIATMHHKEKLIAPLFSKAFNSVCIIPNKFDSDAFGTFSGEVERSLDPITTARNKCLKAMEISGTDLAIASEGSFGPHPSIYFAQADSEIVLLLDKKNKLEFIAHEISIETNFNGTILKNLSELESFAQTVLFPSHALILRKASDSKEDIIKGITSHENLKQAFTMLMDKYGSVYVETDMRAMYNPSRQKVILKTVEKLIEKINSLCPKCKYPDYSIFAFNAGLPCQQCGSPTKSILSETFVCKSCNYSEERMHKYNKPFEEPMYCDICNP